MTSLDDGHILVGATDVIGGKDVQLVDVNKEMDANAGSLQKAEKAASPLKLKLHLLQSNGTVMAIQSPFWCSYCPGIHENSLQDLACQKGHVVMMFNSSIALYTLRDLFPDMSDI